MLTQRLPHPTAGMLRVLLFASLIAGAALFLLLPWFALAQSVEDGFNPDANGAVNVIVTQPDGKILVGGEFTRSAGKAQLYRPAKFRRHVGRGF